MYNFRNWKEYNALDFNNLVRLGGFLKQDMIDTISGDKKVLFVQTKRLSGVFDLCKVYVPTMKIENLNLKEGSFVNIEGYLRTQNYVRNNKSHLELSVRAYDIQKPEKSKMYDNNECLLIGHLAKKPIYRTTPFGREIGEGILAVEHFHERTMNESYYIPFIVWGGNAGFLQQFDAGDKFALEGRLQSRPYDKKMPDGSIHKKIAFEMSAHNVVYLRENNRSGKTISFTK